MYWHYTTGMNLRKIREDGFLRPSETLVPKGERPVLWFTTSEEFERTAVKMIEFKGRLFRLTVEQTAERCDGLYRLGINGRMGLHRFERTCRNANTDQRMVEALLTTSIEQGSDPLRDWWGTLHRVPLSACVIEKFNSGRWE